MSTITTRKAAPGDNVLKARRSLAEELLDLEIELAPALARQETIKTELKAMADELGDSFKEEFAKKGSVAVAPPHEKEFKGLVPQIVSEVWLGLKPGRQKKLVEAGIVKNVENWGKAFNGSVTVKVATEA